MDILTRGLGFGRAVVTGGFAAYAPTMFANGGFEAPVVADADFAFGPTGSSWTWDSGAGITANNSGFSFGHAAPEGIQAAFFQGAGGTASQAFYWAAGTYVVTVKGCRRNFIGGAPDFSIAVDAAVVGTFDVPLITYSAFTSNQFTLAAGTHTLTLTGLGTATGDITVLLDDVRVVAISTPALADPGGAFAAGLSSLSMDGTIVISAGQLSFQ